MKTKLLFLFSAILLSLSLQAQNAIDLVSPPQSVNGNTEVSITFTYTLEASVGWAYIRFKNGDATENNLTHVAVKIDAAGSGTKTVTLPIPSEDGSGTALPLGAGYNYQAQLFDSSGSPWVTLVTNDYNGVTLLEAVVPANYINLVDYPTTVTVDGSTDINFEYATDKTGPVYAYIQLRTAAGSKVAESSPGVQLSGQTSGTGTFSLPVPANVTLGDDYEYFVLIFQPPNWGAAFATDKVGGITVAPYVPPANFITLDDAPTTVASGSDVDITFDYATDVANAHLFIRFRKGTTNLTSVSKVVTAGSGTLTLPLPIPSDQTLGEGYNYQVQIFDIDSGYTIVPVSKEIEGLTLAAAPANTIITVNPPKTVVKESSVDVTLSYTKDIAGDAIALVRFLDENGDSVEQIYDIVDKNSGEITLNLATPEAEGTYSYRAELWSDDFGTLYYKKTLGNIAVVATLGTDKFTEGFKNLSIYPNPFSDSFTFKFDENISDSVNVELFTIDGRKIKTFKNNKISASNTGTIFTGNLSKGMYLVRINAGDLQESRMLIKN